MLGYRKNVSLIAKRLHCHHRHHYHYLLVVKVLTFKASLHVRNSYDLLYDFFFHNPQYTDYCGSKNKTRIFVFNERAPSTQASLGAHNSDSQKRVI